MDSRRKKAPDADRRNAGTLVDAQTAIERLGIKMQTLYAYVSRGWVRAVPAVGGKGNLYYVEDLDALAARGRGRSMAGAGAERMIRWGGNAVMQTSITAIGPEGPRYRGKPAAELVHHHRAFEDCTELLWNGMLPDTSAVWQPARPGAGFEALAQGIAQVARRNHSRRLLSVAVEAYAASLGRNPELTLGAPVLAARQLIQAMSAATGLLTATPSYALDDAPQSIAQILAANLRVGDSPQNLRLLDAALILSADNELAPATFAARIAASAGADLFSCVTTALGAFEGMLTGLGCEQAESALVQASSCDAYLDHLKNLLARKSPVPGYGHPLYPDGDPRATLLLDLVREVGPAGKRGEMALQGVDHACNEWGLKPNLPLALAVLSAVLDAPVGASGALMSVGRAAGWVAHALEQRLAGFLVRPRARYIGPS
ncbi:MULTISPECIES: citrate/2-methylcitrate synthase [unclassified Achromobacter]|uniref:citrate/2-methylcitrate synthase n=1 Tax=unclassified Achromobacter TaxID=2626865 RepID=UPI0013036C47|nr:MULTISPECIES: citrate/2-methylcitrate synthase [unclassified Achromobacter]